MAVDLSPDDMDLGLDIDIPDSSENLFEIFHKGKAADAANKEVNIGDEKKAPPAGQQQQQQTQQTNKGGTEKQEAPAGAANEEVIFKTDNILDLAKENALKKPGEQTQQNADGGQQKSGDKGGTPSPVDAGVFGTLYDHFTTNLGYPALEEGKTITNEDDFIEWQQTVDQQRAEELANKMIEQTFPTHHAQARDLFTFLGNGGTVEQYLSTRQNDDVTSDYLTTTDVDVKEERSRKVIERYHASIGWKPDNIAAYVKKLDAAGQLEAIAETLLPEFVTSEANKKAITDQQTKANKQKSETQIRQFNDNLVASIDTAKEFSTFNLTSAKEKEKVKNYLFSPTVEIDGGQKVPQYLVDLQKARSNPNWTLFQALTLMNGGLDLEKLNEKLTTKAAQTLKERLESQAAGHKLEQPASSAGANQSAQNQRKPIDVDSIEFAT